MVVFASLSICVAAVFFTRASVVFAAIFVLAALMHWIDYRLLKNERAIHDRSCFYYFLWHGHTGKSGLRFWLFLGIGMGIGQIVLQHGLGGLDPLVIKYGIYYPAVIDEWWRFLIGPFFHSGLPHCFANLSALLSIGPIAWLAIGPLPSILTFLFGSTAGAVAAFVISNSNNDSYLGISGGVFALFGLVVILGLTSSRALPRNLAIQYAWLTAIFGIGAEMFINTSTVGHFIGFSTGAVSAITLDRLVLPVGKR